MSDSEKSGAESPRLLLSVVVPLYDEEESLPQLQREIDQVCRKEHLDYEVIYIDDGSRDGSFAVLEDLFRKNKRVRVFQLRRNCGKSEALSAGFAEARGEYVITMDADLQDDPAEIPRLLAALREGYDLVSGWKKKRRDPISKRWPSKFFNWVTARVSGIKIHDFNCGLKAYRREVVRTISLYGELHRYIPVLAKREGFSIGEIVVNHRPRIYGRTKFGASRLLRGAFDLLTVLFLNSYMRRPMHLFGLVGALTTLAGSAITVYLVLMRIIVKAYLSNRPLLFIGVLLVIVGVQFVSIGLIGEMITRSQAASHHYPIQKRLER